MEKTSPATSVATSPSALQLVWPSSVFLPSYVSALEQGWSPSDLRPEAAQEELERIRTDPDSFLRSLVDRQGLGAPVTMPNGSKLPKLPGYRRWIWDGSFCGSIALRWQSGTNTLPDYCLGHIGYSLVPWKHGQGYATWALRTLLLEAPAEGLSYVEVTTSPDNIASQRVIQANGGVLVEKFNKPPEFGGTPELRFRIDL